MITASTVTGSPFQYKEHPDGEIIVYPSDGHGQLQNRSALVITPHMIDLISRTIQQRGRVAVGASRDNPPVGSLGAIVKKEKQSPQQLSYLIPILERLGMCRIGREGKAIIALRKD